MIRVEERGGRLYVYEARREGQRIVRRYLGTAAQHGELAASDALAHQERVARDVEDRALLRASQEEDSENEAHSPILIGSSPKELSRLGFTV